MELENVVDQPEFKYCPRCETPKPTTDFQRKSKSTGALQLWCRECQRKYDRERYKQNRDRMLGQMLEYAKTERGREIRNTWARNKKRKLRLEAVAKLGGKCSNEDCRWLNDDGTLGCKDAEILHIDHIDGGGHKERKSIKSPSVYYKRIIGDTTNKYQLLCANCNWKKRYERGELFS